MLWIGLCLPRLPIEVYERTLATGVNGSWRGPTGHPLVDGTCMAVCDRLRVLQANAAAAAHGVHSGQKRATALALCPNLMIRGRDLVAEQRALAQIACWALQFTPRISLREPDEQDSEAGLVLDIESSLKLFDGLDRLLTRVRLGLDELGFSARIGCAPTATASWLFARFRDGQMARSEAALDTVLAELPVTLLESLKPRVAGRGSPRAGGRTAGVKASRTAIPGHAAPGHAAHRPAAPAQAVPASAAAIEAIGARVFRDLVRLPRNGLARRFGQTLLLEMDMALGIQPEVLPWFDPPRRFDALLELVADVEDAESLVFAARRLLVQLTGWLTARQVGVRRLLIEARHDRTGRHPVAPFTPIELRFALPNWQTDPMVAVLRERLALIALPAPVHALVLRCDEIVARPVRHASLLPDPAPTEENLGRLVERLQARLGHEQVRRLELVRDHRPEAAYRIRPLDDLPLVADDAVDVHRRPPSADAHRRSLPADARRLPLADARRLPLPADARRLPLPADARRLPPLAQAATVGPTPRPLWLLEEPQPLVERQQRPWWQGPLRLLAGPERIEGGWWDGHFVERDYFIAESDQSQWVWIFRTRAGGGDPETPPAHRWFLQGIFG